MEELNTQCIACFNSFNRLGDDDETIGSCDRRQNRRTSFADRTCLDSPSGIRHDRSDVVTSPSRVRNALSDDRVDFGQADIIETEHAPDRGPTELKKRDICRDGVS
jgi:hypothetical protein